MIRADEVASINGEDGTQFDGKTADDSLERA